MRTALDILELKIKELEQAINPTIQQAIEDNEDELITIQTEEQLEEGENSKGEHIEPPYTDYTKNLKRLKGQPFNKVTWRDTGRLYDSIKVTAQKNKAEIDASVPYIDDLEEKYGEDVLGIQDERLSQFTEDFIIPAIQKKYEQITKS